MKRYYLILILSILCFKTTAQKPIIFDNIHYVVSDSSVRNVAVDYFKTFFKGQEMAEQPMNPLTFINLIALRPDEATFNISVSGPFEGLQLGDINYLQREESKSKTVIPPMYGVRWVAINTKSIKKTVKKLLQEGYNFAAEDFFLPTEPDANAVAMYGFDNNIIVLVERPALKSKTTFGIDHLQLIVKNLEENVKFYQDVLGAEIIDKIDRSTVLKIGDQRFILSEPEALGLSREQVTERDSKKYSGNIDHLGFLYDEIEPAFYAAKANNYKIIVEPQSMVYFDKPTPYTVCILMSPDNLQIDLEQEEGRLTARKISKEVKK
jgi:catechol 2,3-dioxygenase-like lactoylglutathione lyase family enzyme